MDILMGLVIAMFIITAVFVGYHASQEPAEIGEHNINAQPETLSENSNSISTLQKVIISKSS